MKKKNSIQGKVSEVSYLGLDCPPLQLSLRFSCIKAQKVSTHRCDSNEPIVVKFGLFIIGASGFEGSGIDPVM